MIITHTDYEGLAAIVMEDERLRAVVIPGWGGKIASLYDLRHDREWLHRNPHLPTGCRRMVTTTCAFRCRRLRRVFSQHQRAGITL